MRVCRSLFLLPVVLLAVPATGRAAATEPSLVRTTLTLAPTAEQLATLPRFAAAWWLAPNVAPDLRAVLTAAKFSPALVERLARAVVRQDDGAGLITPEATWLDEFTPSERARWQVLLALHRNNDTYRWPLRLREDTLAALTSRAEFREIVARIRRWAQSADADATIFADAWALEDAFATADARREFFQAAFRTDTPFLKLRTDAPGEDAATWAAYWQVNGRYRAIEPFYNAVQRVTDHDRVDLAHILPRFARSVLYTYPPEFAAGRDLAVECGLAAAEFFTREPEGASTLEAGFSDWLQRECVALTEAPRFGDIVVFEDPARTRWPYAAVHIADGLVFARQPTLFGPWCFLDPRELPRLNPRLGATAPRVFRRKSALTSAGAAPFRIGGLPASWRQPAELRAGRAGPWGRLATYRVLLAPPGDALENLPVPDATPEWPLLLTDRAALRADLVRAEMSADTRRELLRLLDRAPGNRDHVVTLRPKLDFVFQLPGPVRARLYRDLIPGTSSAAYVQTFPIASRVPPEEWFAPGDLAEPTRTAVLQLVYPHGRAFAFSDYGALFTALPMSREERLSALRAVLRVPAQVVLLEKPAPEEVPALVRYWQGNQQKDLTTLLTAFAANDDVRYLDIVHLLPPLAREFLNLYAFTDVAAPAASCYWSALNFDVPQPDSRLLILANHYGTQSGLAWEKLQADFVAVTEPGALGDVIAYRETAGRHDLVHVGAFIADDIVFTKNGLGLMAPWCLMELADLDAMYLAEGVERLCFRRKSDAGIR